MRACCWVVKDRRTAERVIPAEAARPTEAGTDKECSAYEANVRYARESALAERLERSQTTLAAKPEDPAARPTKGKVAQTSAEIKVSAWGIQEG